MKEIGLGLLGFGTIGAGVVEGLQRNGEMIAQKIGVSPVVLRIADLDTVRDRGVRVDPSILTTDAFSVVRDPSVSVVVELIGGTGVARDLIKEALRLRKPVVTANKALLAKHGSEIFALATRRKTDLYFGASVGGGIPIIRALREGLVANRVEWILGILNGTCNYILTRMAEDGLGFDEALEEAKGLGYAEADPSLDIDGHDTAHKAAILATLACGFQVPLEAIHVEGIRDVSQADIRYARELGYCVKLLAVIRRYAAAPLARKAVRRGRKPPMPSDEVEIRVHPALVPEHHVLASVNGVFNAAMVHGDLTGDTLYYGRGAGRLPTAGTVIADIVDVLRNLQNGCPGRIPAVPFREHPVHLRRIAHGECRYYIRMSALDQPGVLGRIASVLGRHRIGIASVRQKEMSSGEYVPLVVLTDRARESHVARALVEIENMDVIRTPCVRFRIEE